MSCRFVRQFATLSHRFEDRTASCVTSGSLLADTTIIWGWATATVRCRLQTSEKSTTAQTTMLRERRESLNSRASSPETNRSFKRSVILMTFAGEELGLFGSSHFVNHPPVPLASINAMFNMDMIGRLANRSLNVMGTGTAPEFPAWIEDANKEIGLSLALSNGGHEGSDHLSFDGKHIPTLFFFSGLHSDYHRPTDTADKIDAKGAVQVLSLVARAAELAANVTHKACIH